MTPDQSAREAAKWVVMGVEQGLRNGLGIAPHARAPSPNSHWPITSASLQVALKEGELRARGYFDEAMILTPEKLEAAARIMRRRM